MGAQHRRPVIRGEHRVEVEQSDPEHEASTHHDDEREQVDDVVGEDEPDGEPLPGAQLDQTPPEAPGDGGIAAACEYPALEWDDEGDDDERHAGERSGLAVLRGLIAPYELEDERRIDVEVDRGTEDQLALERLEHAHDLECEQKDDRRDHDRDGHAHHRP